MGDSNVEAIDSDDVITVSVVIASNRDSAYLPEAVASVRQQSHPVEEIILVGDGAGQRLAERAQQLGIRYIAQPASGVSIARNRGTAAARGEFIAYLDDDDVWHPDRINLQLEALREHPAALAASCGGWYLDGQGNAFGAPWPAPPASRESMLSGAVDTPSIGTLLIRREAMIACGGFHPAFVHGEDNELILRLLQQGQFVTVDRPLFGYRRHGENVSGSLLEGRTGSLRLLQVQIWGAEAHRNEWLSAALQANRRRFSRGAGRATAHDLFAAIRRRRWGNARASVAWGARNRGARFIGDICTELIAWVRRR